MTDAEAVIATVTGTETETAVVRTEIETVAEGAPARAALRESAEAAEEMTTSTTQDQALEAVMEVVVSRLVVVEAVSEAEEAVSPATTLRLEATGKPSLRKLSRRARRRTECTLETFRSRSDGTISRSSAAKVG